MKVMRPALKSGTSLRCMVVLAIALVLIGAIALKPGLGTTAQAQDRNSDDKGLQGTWRVTVQRIDCQTRANIGPPFPSLLSFAKGGTFTEIPGTPTFLPGQRTPGIGVWTLTGERSFKAISEAFILFDSVSPPYVLISPLPPSFPLFHKGKQRITQTIEVNGDESTADAFVQFFDTNGTELSSICADAALHRLEIE